MRIRKLLEYAQMADAKYNYGLWTRAKIQGKTATEWREEANWAFRELESLGWRPSRGCLCWQKES